MIEWRDIAAWASGVAGAAVAAWTLFRWHWFEIRRAHTRIDALELELRKKHA